jgi:hypothetical protein
MVPVGMGDGLAVDGGSRYGALCTGDTGWHCEAACVVAIGAPSQPLCHARAVHEIRFNALK